MIDNIKTAETLFAASQFSDAELFLKGALKKNPESADLNALYGLALAFTDKEEEAARRLGKAKGSKFVTKLTQILVDHFYCRTQLSKTDTTASRYLASLKGFTPQSGTKLSACLIVKNEEAMLGACLDSLKGLVDEVVVVDTGSTDSTLEIAKKHGAVIGHFTWINDFSAARNEALKLATGNWVLWIDADERLSRASHEVIRQALTRPHFAGFNIPILNFMSDTGEAEQYIHAPTRLFQLKPFTKFEGKIHEQVTPSLEQMGLPFGTLDTAQILHEGYRPSMMSDRDKLSRTLHLLQAEVEAHPQSSFQWFNLANAYAIAGKFEQAERACRLSIKCLEGNEPHAATVHQILIETLEHQGRIEEALDTAEAAALAGFGNLVTFFTRANILFKAGRFEEAIEPIEACLKMEWPTGLQGDFSVSTFKRHVLHGQILAALQRDDEALQALQTALDVAPDCATAKLTVATIDERRGEFKTALATYQELEGGELSALSQLGKARCLQGLGERAKAVEAFSEAFRSGLSIDAWVGWVQCAEDSGDNGQLLQAYEAIASVAEPNADILINWGRALEVAGDVDRALSCFSEALKRDDQNPNVYFNCGDLLYRMKQYADAAHLYESGLRLAPLHPEGWFVLGNSLGQLGIVDGARLAYRQCLALAPEHHGAKNNMEFLQEAYPLAG